LKKQVNIKQIVYTVTEANQNTHNVVTLAASVFFTFLLFHYLPVITWFYIIFTITHITAVYQCAIAVCSCALFRICKFRCGLSVCVVNQRENYKRMTCVWQIESASLTETVSFFAVNLTDVYATATDTDFGIDSWYCFQLL